MDTNRICSICGKPLAPNAPEGLCAECLLKAGLGTGADIGPDTGGKAPRFTPPKIEELAAKFPLLEILEFIGQGGMGAVYKARQTQLDRVVALKILPPQAAGAAFADRFTREARALAKLNHPHIVTLYEFGQSDGLFYFLMEFVDGVNLRQLLGNSRISPREALAIVPQICEALQFAHDSGIVHRDIKPENILLDKKGQVKIADFGVAKMIAESLTEASEQSTTAPGELTKAGSTLGTPQYMAPEQIKNSAEVDHRADIYSLGVVFYQMLTGELPASKIEPPSRKVRIDVRLDEVVLRALEKKPELRFQQASDVKTMVETIATTPPFPPSETPAGLKHYKNSKWNFELDIPENWNIFPPNHGNSIYELLRFGSSDNGRHLLILFRSPHNPAKSLEETSDDVQKILTKAGFGNFVSADTTIGDRPVRTLDFDRPEGNHIWSCREYFIVDGMLAYVLGFGTTDKAGKFETFDRIAKSFRFQASGHEPFFPKTQPPPGEKPKPMLPGQKTEAELGSEGFIVRIEPIKPRATRRFVASAVIVFLTLLLAALVVLNLVKSHEPYGPNVLTEAQFLKKFDANQIVQATITYPTASGGAATIIGKFIETDANGETVEQNGQPVEESFVTPNVVLTSSLEDKLLPAQNIRLNIPNPIVSDIGYQLLFFVLLISPFLIITLIIYFIVRKTRGPPAPTTPANSLPNRRSWFNGLFVLLVAICIIAFFLCRFVLAPYRMETDAAAHSASTQTGVLFHFRVFEADAGLVDNLIPNSERSNGVQPGVQSVFSKRPMEANTYSHGDFHMTTHDGQTDSLIAQVSPAVIRGLLQDPAQRPGVLVDQTSAVSTFSWYPGAIEVWTYGRPHIAYPGSGGGSVYFGVRKNNGRTDVRIDGTLSYPVDNMESVASININSRILYEGPTPQTNELVFMAPFLRHDGTAHYLLTVFDFNGQSKEETPNLSLNGPPFTVQLHQATMELAAVGDEPWTNPVCWYPNGKPSPKAFPTGHQADSIPDYGLGSVAKKLVFYVRNRSTNDVSMPICRVDEAWPLNLSSTWIPPYELNHNGYFGLCLGVPTNATTVNLSIGVANGPWETVVSMDRTPNTISGQGIGEDNWRGTYESVTGSKGEVAVGCSYTTRSNWVSRIVYVNGNGKIVPIHETSAGDLQNPATGTLLISSNEYTHIKQFLVQRRNFQWVDLGNISLQSGHMTSVTAKVY
ncbi:MAG TPA: serine/threonine-protein kinase [Verrucomicrobiae bacterium]|jgi:serine/threonine protein kinase|nr:serine/threonine-protein kinase [Verrucomicrobiae bacterium]